MARDDDRPPGPILRAAQYERPDAGRDTERHDAAANAGGEPQPQPGGEHGRVPSWIYVFVVIAAFLAGGVALVADLWWLFWVGVGVVVLSVPAGKIIGVMNDTVEWDVPWTGTDQPQGHAVTGSAPQSDLPGDRAGRPIDRAD